MKTSEFVEQLKEKYTETPLTLTYPEGKRTIMDPNEELTGKALIKICEMWNATDGSRNFLKHLIKNFLPINPMSKILTFSEEDIQNNLNRCCILGIKLASVKSITDYWSKFMTEKTAIDGKAMMEKRTELTEQEKRKLEKLKKAMPVEVRNATIAYMADGSSKFMSAEALLALKLFVEECVMGDVKEVVYIINPKPVGKKKFTAEKKTAGNTFGLQEFVGEDVLEKLKNAVKR